MAEQEAHDSETLVKDEKEEVLDIESQVKVAMRSRVGHFKDQADSLTFEGVRRLLEKDMGLETYALDVHKRFIKQLLQELLEEANDGNDSKHEETEEKGSYEETGEKGVAGDEEANSPEGHQPNKDVKESFSKDEEKMGDSPVLGLLTGNKTTESKTEESKGANEKKAPNKSMIKTAIRKRTQYLKANLENLSIRDLRRLLEKDLKLDIYSLDPYKKFIGEQVDEVLSSAEVSKSAPTVKKNVGKNNSQRKVAKKASSEENSDSLGDESDEEEEVKPRKKTVRKGKMDSNGSKRKRPTKDTKISGKKRVKPATEDNSDEEDNGNVSEDGQSQSSAEKSTKKKVVSTPAYGKRVENLKSIIKACGMSVPPSVYKKVKQVPENKREAQLIKELEEILSKEGLSANPSEKEIKECKKRKERARELEGIDTSNIVSSSRRRSTASFVAPPPKPKIPVEKDADDGEGTEDDGDDDNDEEEEEEDNDNSAESQSEESNEDDDDDENSD